MNIDNGMIQMLSQDSSAIFDRLVPIELASATEKQRKEMRVSLNDHTSTLGRQLTVARSKYTPHVGAKEAAKLAAK